MSIDAALSGEQFCYLTTTGRVSGEPHTIEIWFALQPEAETLYMLSGGRERSDWVRNLRKQPEVSVRIARQTFAGTARIVRPGAEDALARRLLVEKYASASDDLSGWGRTSLPVAVSLSSGEDA